MRSVAEIEEELNRAKAAEAQNAKRAEAEKHKQERQAEIKRTTAYMRELHAKLIAAGVVATLRESRIGDNGVFYLASIDVESLNWRIDLDHRGGRSYGSERSYQINVGSYGNRKVYPRLKADTFKYDLIVEDVKSRVEKAKRDSELYAERGRNRAASELIVQRLREQFNLPEHRLIAVSETDATKVKFELKTLVDEEQARAILRAVIDANATA